MAKKKHKKTKVSSEALERARRELRNEAVSAGEVAPVAPAPPPPPPVQPAYEDEYDEPEPVRASVQPATSMIGEASSLTRRAQENLIIKRTMTRDELAAEYGYVINDLTSMGILAGILFVAMVAFAFVFV